MSSGKPHLWLRRVSLFLLESFSILFVSGIRIMFFRGTIAATIGVILGGVVGMTIYRILWKESRIGL